jgi:hypothetical protein
MLSHGRSPSCLAGPEGSPPEDPAEWPWNRVPSSELTEELTLPAEDERAAAGPSPCVVAAVVLLLGVGCLLW